MKNYAIISFFGIMLLLAMASCGTAEQTTSSSNTGTVLVNSQFNQADDANQELINDANDWADINCQAKAAQIEARKNPDNAHLQKTAQHFIQKRDNIMAKIRQKYETNPELKEEFQKALGEARKTLPSCQRVDSMKK